MTKPHKIYFSINLTPWRNQFIQYGLYVIEKFVLCHGYEKILQTLNSNLVLLHVRHYAFTLAKQFSAEGRDVFLGNLVHLHVLQYFFAVAKEFLAVGTRRFPRPPQTPCFPQHHTVPCAQSILYYQCTFSGRKHIYSCLLPCRWSPTLFQIGRPSCRCSLLLDHHTLLPQHHLLHQEPPSGL